MVGVADKPSSGALSLARHPIGSSCVPATGSRECYPLSSSLLKPKHAQNCSQNPVSVGIPAASSWPGVSPGTPSCT